MNFSPRILVAYLVAFSLVAVALWAMGTRAAMDRHTEVQRQEVLGDIERIRGLVEGPPDGLPAALDQLADLWGAVDGDPEMERRLREAADEVLDQGIREMAGSVLLLPALTELTERARVWDPDRHRRLGEAGTALIAELEDRASRGEAGLWAANRALAARAALLEAGVGGGSNLPHLERRIVEGTTEALIHRLADLGIAHAEVTGERELRVRWASLDVERDAGAIWSGRIRSMLEGWRIEFEGPG